MRLTAVFATGVDVVEVKALGGGLINGVSSPRVILLEIGISALWALTPTVCFISKAEVSTIPSTCPFLSFSTALDTP